MKISNELRQVLRSFCQSSRKPSESKWARRERALKDFLRANPRVQQALKKAQELDREGRKLSQQATRLAESFGLSVDGQRIVYEDRFERAGGRKIEEPITYYFDNLVTQLALSTDHDGREILAKLGIKWE